MLQQLTRQLLSKSVTAQQQAIANLIQLCALLCCTGVNGRPPLLLSVRHWSIDNVVCEIPPIALDWKTDIQL